VQGSKATPQEGVVLSAETVRIRRPTSQFLAAWGRRFDVRPPRSPERVVGAALGT